MKIYVRNTPNGLIPLYDSDYDEKRRLKLNSDYLVTIKEERNLDFHRKYFALINTSWEYLREEQQKFFRSKEAFRKTVQIAAGNCDTIYSIKRKEWIEQAKSVSFEKMDDLEFAKLYEGVKDVIFSLIGSTVTEQEFNDNLRYF